MEKRIKIYLISSQIFLICLLVLLPGVVYAQEVRETDCPKDTIRLQIPIPFIGGECWIKYEKPLLKYTGNGQFEELQGETIHYVTDIRSYIAGFYKFFIGAIAFLAVVMVMVGGFVWLLAAGNQGRITEAKNMIGGALGGLLLALGSYVLFNTLNPDIVNLKLQKPSGINPIVQASQVCAELPSSTKVTHTQTGGQVYTVPDDNQWLSCGNKYEYDPNQKNPSLVGKESKTCFGYYCGPSGAPSGVIEGVCVDVVGLGKGENNACQYGRIAGKVTHDGEAFPVSEVELRALCEKNGGSQRYRGVSPVKSSALNVGSVFYNIPRAGNIDGTCTAYGGTILGYMLVLKINVPGVGILGGSDEWYAIGKHSGSVCDRPLISDDPLTAKDEAWSSVSNAQLFQESDFTEVTFRCDLNLMSQRFPGR